MRRSILAPRDVDSDLVDEVSSKAKSMIGVGRENRPFLDYLLYNVKAAGFQEVFVVIGEGDNSIREYYDSCKHERFLRGLQISYGVQPIPSGRAKPLGTADALLKALNMCPHLQGKAFVVCNSDNLYSRRALELLRKTEHRNATIEYDSSALLFPPERVAHFAVMKKDERGFLTDIVEKPATEQLWQLRGPDGVLGVSMNVFRFTYDDIYAYLQNVPLHPVRAEKELPAAVNMMVSDHPQSLMTYRLAEHVPDLTKISDVQEVRAFIDREFSGIDL